MCQQVEGPLCPSIAGEFEPWAIDRNSLFDQSGVEILDEEFAAIEGRRKEILEKVEIITCSMHEYADGHATISSFLICLGVDGKRKEIKRILGRFIDNKPLLVLSMLYEFFLNDRLILKIPSDIRLVGKRGREGEGIYLLFQGRWFFQEGEESLSNVLQLGLKAARAF